MKSFAALSGLVSLVAALPAPRPQAVELPSLSLQPGGPIVPTGLFTGRPSFTGSFAIPTGSGFAFPSGGFGHHHHHHHGPGFPFGASGGTFPTGFQPSGAGSFSFPAPTSSFSRSEPTLSAREAQYGEESYTEPIATASATAAPSISFPASGFGGESSAFAAPTGGFGGSSFSFPASGFGGESGSGFAAPTGGFGGLGHKSFSFPGFGGSGFATPTGGFGGQGGEAEKPSFSFALPTETASGFASPTGGFAEFDHHRHHHHESGASGFAAPSGGSFSGLPEGSASGFAAPTGGFSGFPGASDRLSKPTETGSFSFAQPSQTGSY